jgi:hypothetical protein
LAVLAIRNDSSNTDDIKENAIYAGSLLNDGMIEEINEKNQRLGKDLPMELNSLQIFPTIFLISIMAKKCSSALSSVCEPTLQN